MSAPPPAPPPEPAPPSASATTAAPDKPKYKRPEPTKKVESAPAVVTEKDVTFKVHYSRVLSLDHKSLAVEDVQEGKLPLKHTVVAFDLDNTLKYSSKTEKEDCPSGSLPKVLVRGGEQTIKTLESLHKAGALLVVLTARGPSKLKWETCVQELERLNLYRFFKDSRPEASPKEFLVDGDSKVWGGSGVLVCHYYKPHALLAYLDRVGSKPKCISFVDDFAVNVVSFGDHLVQSHQHAAMAQCKQVSCLWYDLKPLIDSGEVAPSRSEDSYDKNYAPYLIPFKLSPPS
eukprot:gb/GEZN01011882.1/.p1 GENE.gb/GEZN01011882.1/~~gb/GEZN01011882.1/.p1  ORF type:complete len:288 (-),score=56.79 gb/GEZN01011882.1/:160-1023(-)